MAYTAQNIDTTKFEDHLREMRTLQQQLMQQKIEAAQAEYRGYAEAIEHVRGMLHCSNYEGNPSHTTAVDGANELIYQLCKELGIMSQDIREAEKLSIQEKAVALAARIIMGGFKKDPSADNNVDRFKGMRCKK